jgi:hypothetical protein
MVSYDLIGLGCVLVVFLLVCLKFYREKNDRKEKINCEKMLMDVFAMQINMPELSLVYDTAKADATQEKKMQYQLKMEPFILYMLSVFDLVIDYYYGKSSFATKDHVMKTAWVNTIKNFFRDSSDGKQIYIAHRSEFNKRFQEFVDEIIKNDRG